MIPPFRRISTDTPDLDRVQDSVSQTLDAVAAEPILNNTLVSTMASGQRTVQLQIGTTFQNVAHGLGRAPLGWIVVRRDADTNIWEDPAGNTNAKLFLRLSASVAVNVTLLVF